MRAHFRIWGASCSPQTISAMLTAFDDAWADIRFQFHDSPESFEASQGKRADAILAAAAGGSRDVCRLKLAGLMAVARHLHLQFDDFGVEAVMPHRAHNPKYWRSYAEETTAIADQIKDPECQRLLMIVAETYAELARRPVADEAGSRLLG